MPRRPWIPLLLGLAVLGLGAGTPEEGTPDRPPDGLAPKARVCCLIDTPHGCTGCGEGATCVYEWLSEYQCVYVVYGTACDDGHCPGRDPSAEPRD